MKLMTKQIEDRLLASPIGSTDGKGMDAEVIVKYFNPIGAGSWYILEGEKQEDGDWLLYGLCSIFEAEFGYVLLSELENIKLPFGMTIERDLYSKGTIGDFYKYELGRDMGEEIEEPEEDGEER